MFLPPHHPSSDAPVYDHCMCTLYHGYSKFFQKEDEEEQQQDEQLDEEELEETDEFDLEIKVSNPEKVGKRNYVAYCVLIARPDRCHAFLSTSCFCDFAIHLSKFVCPLLKN